MKNPDTKYIQQIFILIKFQNWQIHSNISSLMVSSTWGEGRTEKYGISFGNDGNILESDNCNESDNQNCNTVIILKPTELCT